MSPYSNLHTFQYTAIHQEEGRNLRAAVEATVRQVKHPFPASKLPVRGKFRVSCMVIGSAMITNVRRIQCYLEAMIKKENEQECSQEQASVSFFAFLKVIFHGFTAPITHKLLEFGY